MPSAYTPEWITIKAPENPVEPSGKVLAEIDGSLWIEYVDENKVLYACRTDGVYRQWYKKKGTP